MWFRPRGTRGVSTAGLAQTLGARGKRVGEPCCRETRAKRSCVLRTGDPEVRLQPLPPPARAPCASASADLAACPAQGFLQGKGSRPHCRPGQAHFWPFPSEPPVWRTAEQGWIKSLACKPLFTPLSLTHSILQRCLAHSVVRGAY